MTTIAYKDGKIATDGQETAGDVIVHMDAVKCQEFDGVNFFLCGSEEDRDALIAAWPDGKLARDNRAAGFAVNQGALMGCCANEGRCHTWSHHIKAPYAFGSGEQFAMGAMDAGMSAAEAIAIAANRDVATGGTVRVYDAKTGEQIS